MTELTIVAVHGNGGGSFRFERMRPYVPSDVDLVAVDLPGFGGRSLDGRPVTMSMLAEALREQLAACPPPVVVLGHGIGGSIALSALQGRDDLAGLILHAPVAARLDTRWFPRLMQPIAVRRAVQWGISSLPARYAGRLLLFRDGDVPRSYADRFLREYRRTEAFAAMFDLLTADWFDGLEPLDTPTAILWGERDRVLAADQANDLLRVVPTATTDTVDGWGHFPMVERPAAYTEHVVELARSLVGAGAQR